MVSRYTVTLATILAASTCAQARPLQEVLNDGTLRVGVALYSPWAMRAPSGELIGFEIDVARKLAEDMGVEPEFNILAWERIVPALEGGEIDIIAAGLSITPQRALHVNFSEPYAASGTSLVTNLESTALVERLEDLDHPDYTIAAVSGTVAEELAKRIFPRAVLALYDDAELATAALLEGVADAYLENEPVPTFLALENPTRVDVPVSEPLLQTRAGFAVNKGDPDFLAFLNAWIVARESDTWLATIHSYWFESLRWRRQLETENR